MPPAGGTNIRYVILPPDSADAGIPIEQRQAMAHAFFGAMGAAGAVVEGFAHAFGHRTDTTDYVIILSGRISLVLDSGEYDLRPGNIVVQRGTAHSWINKGRDPAVFVAVMIDRSSTSD